jgi:aerobic-type carbon monoxide dehydrogenase small subunit (CoxS/CutS family)
MDLDPAAREAAKSAICEALLDSALDETCFCGYCAAGMYVAEQALIAAHPIIAAQVARATADAIADKIDDRLKSTPGDLSSYSEGWRDAMDEAEQIARSHGSQAQTTENGQ